MTDSALVLTTQIQQLVRSGQVKAAEKTFMDLCDSEGDAAAGALISRCDAADLAEVCRHFDLARPSVLHGLLSWPSRAQAIGHLYEQGIQSWRKEGCPDALGYAFAQPVMALLFGLEAHHAEHAEAAIQRVMDETVWSRIDPHLDNLSILALLFTAGWSEIQQHMLSAESAYYQASRGQFEPDAATDPWYTTDELRDTLPEEEERFQLEDEACAFWIRRWWDDLQQSHPGDAHGTSESAYGLLWSAFLEVQIDQLELLVGGLRDLALQRYIKTTDANTPPAPQPVQAHRPLADAHRPGGAAGVGRHILDD